MLKTANRRTFAKIILHLVIYLTFTLFVRRSYRQTLFSRLSGVDHVYLSQMQPFPPSQ